MAVELRPRRPVALVSGTIAATAFLALSLAGNGALGDPGLRVSYRVPLVEHGLFEFGPMELASPLVTEDGLHVVIGTSAGELHLLRADSGKTAWVRKLDGGVRASPVQFGNELYVGTDNGSLYRLSLCDGDLLWEQPGQIPGAIVTPPVLWKDRVLLVLDDSSVLYAIGVATGDVLADFTGQSFARRGLSPFTIFGYSAPALSGDTLYVGFETGYLASFHLAENEDGTFAGLTQAVELGPCAPGRMIPPPGTEAKPPLCSPRRVFRDVDSTPVVLPGGVLSGCYCRGLFLADTKLARLEWEASVLGPSSPTLAADRAFVASADGAVYSVDLASGKTLWATEVGVAVLSAPAIIGDPETLNTSSLVVATGAALFLLEASSGRILDRITSQGGVSAQPAVAGSAVFVLSNEGVLYRMDFFR